MDALSVFTKRNYRHQTAATSLFANAVISFFMEGKSNVITDVNSAKMSDLFAVAEILMVDSIYTTMINRIKYQIERRN